MCPALVHYVAQEVYQSLRKLLGKLELQYELCNDTYNARKVLQVFSKVVEKTKKSSK